MVLVNFEKGDRLLSIVQMELVHESTRIAVHAMDDRPGAFSKCAGSHKQVRAGSACRLVLVQGQSPFYFHAAGEGWKLRKFNGQLMAGSPAIEYAKDC